MVFIRLCQFTHLFLSGQSISIQFLHWFLIYVYWYCTIFIIKEIWAYAAGRYFLGKGIHIHIHKWWYSIYHCSNIACYRSLKTRYEMTCKRIKATPYWHHVCRSDVKMMSIWCRFDVNVRIIFKGLTFLPHSLSEQCSGQSAQESPCT